MIDLPRRFQTKAGGDLHAKTFLSCDDGPMEALTASCIRYTLLYHAAKRLLVDHWRNTQYDRSLRTPDAKYGLGKSFRRVSGFHRHTNDSVP